MTCFQKRGEFDAHSQSASFGMNNLGAERGKRDEERKKRPVFPRKHTYKHININYAVGIDADLYDESEAS